MYGCTQVIPFGGIFTEGSQTTLNTYLFSEELKATLYLLCCFFSKYLLTCQGDSDDFYFGREE